MVRRLCLSGSGVYRLATLDGWVEDGVIFRQQRSFATRFVLRILHCHLPFPRPLEIFGSTPELSQALAQGAAQLRQLAWPKKNQRRDNNNEQFGSSQTLKD